MASNNKDKKLGWHFLPANLTLEYGDGRKVAVGQKLSISSHETPQCCSVGMHASEKITQAASFKKGPVLCRVEVSGDIDTDSDKFCGRHRVVLAMRELKLEDFKTLGRHLADSSLSGVSNVSSGVTYLGYVQNGQSTTRAKAEKWLEDWFNKGAKTQKVVYVKPNLDERTVLGALSERVVRTETELKKDLGGAFDLSNWHDLLDDLCFNGKICVVEDYTRNGVNAYVRRPTR